MYKLKVWIDLQSRPAVCGLVAFFPKGLVVDKAAEVLSGQLGLHN